MKVSKPKAISSAHAILKVFRFGYVSMRTYFERGGGKKQGEPCEETSGNFYWGFI